MGYYIFYRNSRKVFEPSSLAASADGPALMLILDNSSLSPKTSGISGPIITKSINVSFAKLQIFLMSFICISIHLPIFEIQDFQVQYIIFLYVLIL